jgi:hypothetical protein
MQLISLSPIEPSYKNKLVNGTEFSYDMEKIKYLIEVIGKYNNQNEARFTKNIISLLQVIKV